MSTIVDILIGLGVLFTVILAATGVVILAIEAGIRRVERDCDGRVER